MYYIVDEDSGCYYAGKCSSDNKTCVWKNHYTRGIGLNSVREANIFATKEGLCEYTVEFADDSFQEGTKVSIVGLGGNSGEYTIHEDKYVISGYMIALGILTSLLVEFSLTLRV